MFYLCTEHKDKNMRNKTLTLLAILLAACCATASAQCVIPITDGQSYTQNFDDGTMECWTVEATGNGTWSVMNGSATNVVAFQNASSGDEARLISPTFDLSGVGSATLNFSYTMMALYNNDVLTVSYRTSETDSWHTLDSYSINDWQNYYEASFALPDISATYQISFLGQSNGGYYIFIDNIELMGEGGCARPVSLQATEITPFSALIGWSTTGNEEGWTLEYNGQTKPVNEQPFLLESLEPETDYTLRVKADCGGGMESEWSLPITFKTLCDVIVVTDDEPYFDDFEGSEDFICWQDEIASGEFGWAIDPGYLNPNNAANFFSMGVEALLISATFDLTAVTNPTLEFKHRQPMFEGYNEELYVVYRTAPSDTWHVLARYPYPVQEWETEILSLPEASATYQIGFDAISHNGDGVYVDDVRVGNAQNVGIADEAADTLLEGEALVFDMLGRLVATTVYRQGRLELDMNDLGSGIYVARISGPNGTAVIKIVKE